MLGSSLHPRRTTPPPVITAAAKTDPQPSTILTVFLVFFFSEVGVTWPGGSVTTMWASTWTEPWSAAHSRLRKLRASPPGGYLGQTEVVAPPVGACEVLLVQEDQGNHDAAQLSHRKTR